MLSGALADAGRKLWLFFLLLVLYSDLCNEAVSVVNREILSTGFHQASSSGRQFQFQALAQGCRGSLGGGAIFRICRNLSAFIFEGNELH